MKLKLCVVCKKKKRATSFYSSYRYKDHLIYSSTCKSCDCARSKRYRAANKDKVHGYTIKYVYGITKKKYNMLLKKTKQQMCDMWETYQ